MPILNSILSWWMKKRMHQIELFIKYPHEVQHDWFLRLIESARFTEWGLKYDYQSISTIEDFKNRVPIQNYDSLKPFIDRLMKGEQNILWNSEVKWFAKSSGTTAGKSKFIPVSAEAMEECHYKGAKDLVSFYCNNNPDTQIFTGKGLILGGSHHINTFNTDSFAGDISAILMQNLPIWAQMIRTPDLSIALMDNWEEKIEKMVQVTVKENVTNISGVPTWTLVLAKRILEVTGKKNLLEVWPNLELFVHGAVSFTPYKDQFRQLIPSDTFQYLDTYNASEGFFGIQDQPYSEEMLLMLDYGVFYEFIPMEEYGKEHPETVGLEEVELNKNYALVISTNAGLWRYIIGDTIKFTSVNPYRIKISGRTRLFINAFGEEVIIENTDQAIRIACEKTEAMIRDYTVAPVYFSESENGAHEWLIEFEKQPDNLEYFNEVLDNALKALNSDYEAKRYRNMALRKPIVHVLPPESFYNWLKSKKKLGGQHKIPRLSNDRKFLEEIKEVVRQMQVEGSSN
ncbi:MAG: GH3 auxin-responsive promoter family protein [Bacteroidetes bacterium]|nr:GH3 auxin-responsive promoter family protein [Bacteroidota bacterium]